MGFRDIFKQWTKKPDVAVFHQEHITGAYGGVPPRITPSAIDHLFSLPPLPFRPGGIQVNLAARPPAAPMLDSGAFHSGIPTATGMVRNTPSTGFTRGGGIIPSAQDAASHINPGSVHPTTVRKNLRGTG